MQILDSTLREGELFKVLPTPARVKLASKLAEAGLERVELTVDYPPRTSFEDNQVVIRALHDGGSRVVLHGRAAPEDVRAISRYDVEGCALYIAVSKIHLEHKLHGISEAEAFDRLCDSVAMARDSGCRYIRATLEDASRVYLKKGEEGLELLMKSAQRLERAGATLLSIPDTSGLMTPDKARSFFGAARSSSPLPLSAHFHNDYGLASANTVESGLGGAEELQVTVMGVGDRNGIADLYEVVASLEDVHGISTGLDRDGMRPLYAYFTRIAGIELPWRHPLSEPARTVRAGVHQSMTVRRKDGYIPAKKLLHDFGEPLYAVSPYISHTLVQAIVAPYAEISPASSKRVAEALAGRSNGGAPNFKEVQAVIREEIGVDIPDGELAHYFAAEKLYILLKLSPQFPAQAILEEISSLEGVDAVDEVYGDADMVVRARAPPGKNNVVSVIKQRYANAIQEMRVLVTD